MTDKLRESLSALMDDEANELELERVLKCTESDEELRATWLRYNLARHAANGQQVTYLHADISQQVQAAIRAPGNLGVQPGLKQRMLRPVASFAVAASVAATVVIGGQQLAQVGGTSEYDAPGAVAISTPPVGVTNIPGATAVRASYGTQPIPGLQPMTRTAYQDLAQQRLTKYSQEHAEQAALNSPQGLMSFARVPQIRQ